LIRYGRYRSYGNRCHSGTGVSVPIPIKESLNTVCVCVCVCVCVRVSSPQGFTFLISSDYERAEWRELVHQQQKKCKECVRSGFFFCCFCNTLKTCALDTEHGGFLNTRNCFSLHCAGYKSFSLTSLELQMLTNSCVKLQTVHSIPVIMSREGSPVHVTARLPQ